MARTMKITAWCSAGLKAATTNRTRLAPEYQSLPRRSVWRASTFTPCGILTPASYSVKHVPLPTVSKRLGHANPAITLAIYSHAMEADELAAAKTWDDTMADVIADNSRKWRAPRIEEDGRGGRIRTCGLLVPNQALYQAEPRPEVVLLSVAGQSNEPQAKLT